MAESLRAGIFPVRWMSHAAYDLGYPFFSYYAALPYYVSAALTALGLDVLTAIRQPRRSASFWPHLPQRCGLVDSAQLRSTGAARHRLHLCAFSSGQRLCVVTRSRSSTPSSGFPDFVVAGSPRGASDRGAGDYGGHCLWWADRHTQRLGPDFLPFALSYGLALAAHDGLRAGNGWPAAHTVWRSWVPVLSAFVLGFALTAWFWLPAIAETDYGQMGTEFTEGYFHYSQHFRGLNLVQASLTFDYSVAGTTAESGPFAMGFCQAYYHRDRLPRDGGFPDEVAEGRQDFGPLSIAARPDAGRTIARYSHDHPTLQIFWDRLHSSHWLSSHGDSCRFKRCSQPL